ncbi:MAG: GxxExxY protein [Lacipirellulaceae bacterium]
MGRAVTGDATVTEQIIRAVIKVHRALGPGFLESVYLNSLVVELAREGLSFESEKRVVVEYDGKPVGDQRLDLVVEGRVVVELKAVEDLSQAHYAQLRSYLKASGLRTGLLVNFAREKADFRRVELKPSE